MLIFRTSAICQNACLHHQLVAEISDAEVEQNPCHPDVVNRAVIYFRVKPGALVEILSFPKRLEKLVGTPATHELQVFSTILAKSRMCYAQTHCVPPFEARFRHPPAVKWYDNSAQRTQPVAHTLHEMYQLLAANAKFGS